MTATFHPASVRRNRRSYPAVRVVMPDPEGGAPYEHKVYSTLTSFDTGAEARAYAKHWIASPNFDGLDYITALKAAWGLNADA